MATTANWQSPALRLRCLRSLRHWKRCKINVGTEQEMSNLKGFCTVKFAIFRPLAADGIAVCKFAEGIQPWVVVG